MGYDDDDPDNVGDFKELVVFVLIAAAVLGLAAYGFVSIVADLWAWIHG